MYPSVCLSVCLSDRPRENSRTEVVSPRFFRQRKELHVASRTNCFSSLYNTWFERRSLLNSSTGYRIGARARTLHFPDTLGRMNLASRLNAVGTFSKVPGTIVDIASYVNGKLITRLKNQPVCERVTTSRLY